MNALLCTQYCHCLVMYKEGSINMCINLDFLSFDFNSLIHEIMLDSKCVMKSDFLLKCLRRY